MDEWIPEPQEQGWLEPPRRRPPTAIGIATPPPPRGRGGSRYFETRMHRIGRAFSQSMFALALGLAAANFVAMPILVSLLACLMGGRLVLQRQRSPFSQRMLNLGSHASRRAA